MSFIDVTEACNSLYKHIEEYDPNIRDFDRYCKIFWIRVNKLSKTLANKTNEQQSTAIVPENINELLNWLGMECSEGDGKKTWSMDNTHGAVRRVCRVFSRHSEDSFNKVKNLARCHLSNHIYKSTYDDRYPSSNYPNRNSRGIIFFRYLTFRLKRSEVGSIKDPLIPNRF